MKTNEVVENMVVLSRELEGHLTEIEVKFLSCLPFLKAKGEILEIGSFMGKSTVILASAARAAGYPRIFACDPLLLSSPTDPQGVHPDELPRILRRNLENHNLLSFVKFYRKKSSELAVEWEDPIRVLWIDGDHTYSGATLDVSLFSPFLEPGGIVCLHDVLHGHEGPIRAFLERIVLSENFANCGCCGSIGYGQYVGNSKLREKQWDEKLRLYTQLSRLIPYIVRSSHNLARNKLAYKLFRAIVSHTDFNPSRWISKMNTWATNTVEIGC